MIGAGGLGHIGIQCLRAMTATRIMVLDPNEAALALTGDWGADETVVVDGRHVDRVLELTDGKGAEVVLDFVGERGAERDSCGGPSRSRCSRFRRRPRRHRFSS